jgi:integrase/recombinase XerD
MGPSESGIQVERRPFTEMVAAAHAGKVRDAMTTLALLLAAAQQVLGVSDSELDRDAERFLIHLTVERGLATNTLAAYRRDLRRYVRFLRARGITQAGQVDDVRRPILHRIGVSVHARPDAAPYKATSVSRVLSAVRSFHRFLVSEGIAPHDPTSEVVRPRIPRPLPHPLSVEEVRRLIEAPDRSTPTGLRDRAILELLYGSGVRVSELTGLDVDDLDLEGGFVRVVGKGGKEREVPIGRHAQHALSSYLTRARRDWRVSGPVAPCS